MKKGFLLLGLVLCITLLVEGSFSHGFLTKFENSLEDILVTPKPFNQDIVILAVDNESISRIGQWPWPREVYAHILKTLENAHPKAVGIDIAFLENSRLGEFDDAVLATTLASISYPIILSAEADTLILDKEMLPRAGIVRTPLPAFLTSRNVTVGHTNLILNPDGVVRKVPLKILSRDGNTVHSFAYEIFNKTQKNVSVEKKPETIPRIVYSRAPGTIIRKHISSVLEDPSTIASLTNKVVLIGATASDLHDTKLTPLSRGVEMPGVEIQANIINMLSRGYSLVPISTRIMQLWILIAILLPVLVFRRFRGVSQPLFVNIILGVFHTTLAIILFENGIIANIIHLNLGWSLSTLSLFGYTYFTTERERREMRKMFSKYVATDVLEYIMKNPDKVSLGGEEKEVTILFSDIRGYTTFSESVTPKELVRVLNRYLTAMTEEILKHRGVLDKYIGDAVMAYWGAPMDDPDHADHAIEAALGMIERLKKFNEELKAEGMHEIAFGIGIYTGPVIIGNVGSEMRLEYTVIGDTVNVASRLEGVNKELHTTLLVGESAKNKIKGKYAFKSMGSVSVKGRKEPLQVYTLDGL
ncbi:MAG: adenylate/guanylate cyclase domain-containing protein [Parcubacteria group bacterium]|nr:adenylate/guanylate cyclase domain-containing protein [Parcubacteria group bacterium]